MGEVRYLHLRDEEVAEELRRRENREVWEQAVIPMIVKDTLELET